MIIHIQLYDHDERMVPGKLKCVVQSLQYVELNANAFIIYGGIKKYEFKLHQIAT